MALRRERGISQARVAEAIDVTFQQVQKYERGINRLSVATLLRICAAFGIPPMAFFVGVDTGVEQPPAIPQSRSEQSLPQQVAEIKDDAIRHSVMHLIAAISDDADRE